jgi:EF hand
MKNILPRIILAPALLLALLSVTPSVRAEEPAAPAKPKVSEKKKAQYDADHDGVLSEEELAELKADAKEKRDARRKEVLEKYDANKNGKLEAEERAVQQADRDAAKAAKQVEKEKRQAELAAKKAEREAAKSAPK